jgi:hypothetical protein
MNYINSSCEHGFCVFKSRDGKTVHMVNKLQINSYFSSIDNNQGESEYEVASKDLKLIKNECTSLAAHINSGVPVFITMQFYCTVIFLLCIIKQNDRKKIKWQTIEK